ncbi:F420-dependent oxidoreductase-like protein [Actinoalloteichus hoggarensis]|uniref:Pyrimidine monooxygenase RutA n=1 Tax=Actinoalloteichus hoggarensis TaxID=1470176 RepID=A0A221W1V9_9PSEU|nr:TIGR03560 family F420-dependent LLM class oxidoreductase [Actinoalloteichus hoggarensis]ASO19780.1 Pyrimidine monooxygenase RutA [Actinoalloteichus hoggarensis]MBB5919513.1 F420-dependent oxidoreductase-like protein [Actinoalloteichus hoggarensis]
MRLGLQINHSAWPDGPRRPGAELAAVARTAEAAGFHSIAVMDHFFQYREPGPSEGSMPEAYTTLGLLAAQTSRVRLLALVTGATYRPPAVLIKAVTALDVLSGGRAELGIGAGWHQEEADGLGLPFPPRARRFEHLEETLRIAEHMWSAEESPFLGTHFRLSRPLRSPRPPSRPHPPVMVGGAGERETLRLVARYAQACNLAPGPKLAHELAVLRAHCEREGRDYDSIEKTLVLPLDIGPRGENVDALLTTMGEAAGLGITRVIGTVPDVRSIAPLELIGARLIPAAARL